MIETPQPFSLRHISALSAAVRPRSLRRTEKVAKRAEAWMGLGKLRTVRWEPFGLEGQCYLTAQHKCLRDGGSVQLGWDIVHEPGLLLGAFHHAIWRAPDGALVDLETPWRPEDHTLLTTFLPDPAPLELIQADPIDDEQTLLARPRKARILALSEDPRALAIVSQFREQIEREHSALRVPVFRRFHDAMLGPGAWLKAVLAG